GTGTSECLHCRRAADCQSIKDQEPPAAETAGVTKCRRTGRRDAFHPSMPHICYDLVSGDATQMTNSQISPRRNFLRRAFSSAALAGLPMAGLRAAGSGPDDWLNEVKGT